jgi:hypothetical protein
MLGQEDTKEFWRAGKRSVGIKGFVPVWERTQPPRLEMVDQIRDKSVDELEGMMAGFSRGRGRLVDDAEADLVDRSPTAASALQSPRDRSERASEESAVSSRSGSVFVPSADER